MKYGVIWDMDGVLLDSHEMIWSSVNRVLGNRGVHLSEEDIKRYVGISFKDDIADWNERYGLNLELKPFTDEVWALELEFLRKMKPDCGLVNLLDELKSQKVPMAVGTSSQRFRVDIILDSLGLESYFGAVVSANDVQKHKPEPDLFLEAARRLKILPERCAVVEDASSGIEAARRGGMKSAGYFNGRNSLEEVAGANLVFRNFSELSYDTIGKLVG